MKLRRFFATVLVVALGAGGALFQSSANAQVSTTANGPYYATPSWDQKITTGRFVILANWNSEAVLDRETGLVWHRSPSTNTVNWFLARNSCNTLAVGHRRGWRLPTIQELASLIDADPANADSPRLPIGHPFLNIQPSAYWSATIFESATEPGPSFLGWHVFFSNGTVGSGSNRFLDNFARAWCVRGGHAADVQ